MPDRGNRHFRALIEHSTDVIALLNAEGTILYTGPSTTRLFGYAHDEFVGHSAFEFIHPADAAFTLSSVAEIVQNPSGHSTAEYRVRHKDGTWRWVESEATNLLAEPDVEAIVLNVRDISERKQDEEARQRRADEFAALFDTARDLAAQQDLPGLLQTIVDRAITLLGTPSGYIYLYDAARSDLELAVSRGLPLSIGIRLSRGEGMAGQVTQTLAPLIVNQYDIWEHRSAQFEGVPFKAALGVPILYAGELIGVLGVSELEKSERQFSEADTHLLSLFASQAAGAVHQTRQLEETRARAEQLALLYDAGLTLNQVLDPEEQRGLLSQIAMRAVHADRAEFLRLNVAANELVFEFGAGYPPKTLADLRGKRFPVEGEQGLAGMVIQNRRLLNLPDVRADPRYVVIDPEIRSGLWVPVEQQGQPRGVLAAFSTRTNAFTPQDERLLVLFANQLSVAMENARLFAETRKRLMELEAVSRLSAALRAVRTTAEMLPLLLDEALALINTSTGGIWLYEAATDELHQLVTRGWFTLDVHARKPGQGLTGRVFATGQPYIAREFLSDTEVHESTRSLAPDGWGGAIVPIRAADQVIGVLTVAVLLPRQLGLADAQPLTTLAEIAGNAIHRSRLHQQTERRLHFVQALHGIDTAIASSLDVRVTLNVLLDHAMTQLGVDAAAVLLLSPSEPVLEYAAGRGFHTHALARTRSRLGEGYAGRAALDRRTTVIRDLSKAEDFVRERGILAERFVSYAGVPLVAKGEVKGVLEVFHRARLTPDDEWRESLEALASRAAIAIDNATLFDGLQRSNFELTLAYDATIEGWSRALDLRDQETEGHTQRVTEITLELARAMGLSEAELVHVRRGSLLHDIGKMGVPDSVLLKPGPLSDEEWVLMRKHPVYAFDMLSPITFLRPALDIPYYHHEKWDGTGYPRAFKGEQIPLEARIFAVVDVWDALRSDRPYRAAWPEERVRAHIAALSGTHFDPSVVTKFLELLQSQRGWSV